MMLYERITFLLVTGTLGLFFVAVVLCAWGVILALNPKLDKKTRGFFAQYAAQASALFHKGREAAFQALESFLRDRIRDHSRVHARS